MATSVSQAVAVNSEPTPRFAALRIPAFRLYWLATVSSALGDISEAVVRNWLVWELAFMRRVTHKGGVVLGFTFSYAFLIIVFAGLAWYVPVGIASLVLVAYGASFVIHQASINTLLLIVAPESVRGRMMGLYSMSVFGLQIFNGPAVGTLAVIIGMSATLSMVGAVIVAMTLFIGLKVPALRRLD